MCMLIFPDGAVVNISPVRAGHERDSDSITASGRSPGGRNGTSLQYSCRDNPMNKGAWRTTVHGVTKNQTPLSNCACTDLLYTTTDSEDLCKADQDFACV